MQPVYRNGFYTTVRDVNFYTKTLADDRRIFPISGFTTYR